MLHSMPISKTGQSKWSIHYASRDAAAVGFMGSIPGSLHFQISIDRKVHGELQADNNVAVDFGRERTLTFHGADVIPPCDSPHISYTNFHEDCGSGVQKLPKPTCILRPARHSSTLRPQRNELARFSPTFAPGVEDGFRFQLDHGGLNNKFIYWCQIKPLALCLGEHPTRYSIHTHKADNVLVIPPESRVSMGGGDHPYANGSHAHLLLYNFLKNYSLRASETRKPSVLDVIIALKRTSTGLESSRKL
ncbi:hypothetical protein EVAR_4630_1 [Eumeta japonica]|uniref:Uncharacterized protein n=1 Tax=Eumeta variegata TaxID=151549 RepID=A0A4C1SZ04_EUMVA|nr:hypothetical protein EVAR_4630_1 [Eumeta japonica]